MNNFIKYLIFFLLIPFPGLAQTPLINNTDISNIASRVKVSEKGIITGLFDNRTSTLLPLSGFAGTIISPSYTTLSSVLNSYIVNLNNTVIVNQNGDYNLAQVSQYGSANVAVLEQAGNHITNKVTQIGNGNIYGSSLTGNNHYLKVSQLGDNNLYILDYNLKEPINNTVLQTGSNLKAVQLGGGKPYEIKEFGTGMNIIVRHYNW